MYTQLVTARTLEPKLYSNTPIDGNVIFLVYDHTQGAIPHNQSIGISKRISDYTFEFGAEAEFYTTNGDFYGVIKRKQDPVYSMQAYALYTFQRGMWLALGVTYYWGGEYINDGIGTSDEVENARMGMTFAMPIDKQNAIKIYGNTGISVRYGTNFDSITVAWQYS